MRTAQDIIAKHENPCLESLIPLLQEVQAELGFLSGESMTEIANALNVPVSRVFGVATFYNQFRFAPLGKHLIQVCRGTACHVRGSLKIVEQLRRRLKLREDGSSRDGNFSMLTVACIGACSIAPVINVDGEFYGHLTMEKLDQIIDDLEANLGKKPQAD